jgi:hypothetical protein
VLRSANLQLGFGLPSFFFELAAAPPLGCASLDDPPPPPFPFEPVGLRPSAGGFDEDEADAAGAGDVVDVGGVVAGAEEEDGLDSVMFVEGSTSRSRSIGRTNRVGDWVKAEDEVVGDGSD